ncbi:MAG: site-specific DNA-methyltransferase [Nitrosomonadales bacterium]|jgi:DNA modification methylase|nr:site-specific DNA-methyltransferase [Nitrosomonadales bacterium]
MVTKKALPIVEQKNLKLYLSDFKNVLPLKNIQTVIVDPPYNINFNYGKNYKDNMNPDEYKKLMYDVLNLSFRSTKKDSSMFLINYPEIIAELFQTIKLTDWRIHQWISWVYPSNIGHSKRKFTTAQRSILWLTKEEPKIYIDRVSQPYKNPTDRRVKKLIESGKTGTNLYNWWEINLVKNVSKDKELYVNQIPREVLKRLILVTTDKRNIVLDPMCGTGSTALTAQEEGRVGIGIDLNPDLKKIWKQY